MEWVQTTGRTVDEAVDAALDELGVHAEDVEVGGVAGEVGWGGLEEPRGGFLGGSGGSEARVRVRLKPISREKPQDRRRGRKQGGSRRKEGGGGSRRNEGGGRPKSRGGSRRGPEKPARATEQVRGEEAPAVEHD